MSPLKSGVEAVKEFAEYLIRKLNSLLAPDKVWAPKKAGDGLYQPFLWLGEHLAVAIFICVVVVCGVTAWQGVPRLRQMGASVGWTMAAVAGMASVPGIVVTLNKAVSAAFKTAFNSNEGTLFGAIRKDLETAADVSNPLAQLVVMSALVVSLGIAMLVFMARNIGVLAFVCIGPLVLASLARGGDTSAVKTWAQRLLGLMLAPFALLAVSPFVAMVQGSLIMDALLLVAADVLMLRMIFHGIPYFGPRVARGARDFIGSRTDSRLVHALGRAGAPDRYEEEDAPRYRTVRTPGRAAGKDADVLYAAYGGTPRARPGRMTADSTAAQVQSQAARTSRITEVRQRERQKRQAPPRDDQS